METSSKVTTSLKSEDFQVLANIITKINTGQKLTSEETDLFKALTGQLDSAKKTVVKKQTEAEKQAKHEAEFEKWFSEYKVKFNEQTFSTSEQFKTWQKENIADMPKLSRRTNTGGNIKKLNPTNLRPDSYSDICYRTLKDNPKGVSLEKLGEAIVKIKPDTAKMNALNTAPLWKVYAQRVPQWFNVRIENDLYILNK